MLQKAKQGDWPQNEETEADGEINKRVGMSLLGDKK